MGVAWWQAGSKQTRDLWRMREQQWWLTAEPGACEERRGPTPFHPEPGRETRQRGRYWRFDRWETTPTRLSKTKPVS